MTHIGRRAFLGVSATGAVAGWTSGRAAAAAPAGLTVGHLRTAQLINPLGLEDSAPSLSWQIGGTRRGIMQSAYRIRVASSRAALRAGKADLWDSGRVESAQSIGIAYGGTRLASRQRAWWTVSIWDDKGVMAAATQDAWWEMALLAPNDWTAQWIAAESVEEKADRLAGMPAFVAPVAPEGQTRLFRLPFAMAAAGEAVLTLFSSGYLRNLTIDGQPLEMPPHPATAFGGPGAACFRLPLSAGAHMIAAEVTPVKGFAPATELRVAAHIRLPDSSHVTEGWQTSLNAAEGWRLAGSPDTGWTAPTLQTPQPIAPWPATPAVMMRHSFTATARKGLARLYVAALGAYDMRINGRAVSQDRLQSESSDYRQTILYRCYDVSDLVQAGDNVLGALVGDGWYASYMAPAGRYAFGGAPRRLIAQLEIDGQVIAQTGSGWSMAQSPILSSELYDGEHYDARLEQPGWDAPGFDDKGWIDCWGADRPGGALTAQISPAVRITRTLKPIAMTRPVPGVTVVDFGQNFAGLARLKVKGRAGETITLRYAEIVKSDGTVDQSNLRAALATDRYILRGDPQGESWLPHFTFHGFRYVQVEGAPSDWSIDAMVMSSDLPETGLLRIDNPVVQKLWLNSLWSQRSNFLAIPTDCPQRDERLGWSGDAQVFWDAAAFNMDVAAFTRRFLRELRNGQSVKGGFPIFAPTVGGAPGGSPGWADAGVMLPWICWRRYGDTAMVAEHWDAMCRYVDGVIADNPDLIWRKVFGANFGDWLALDARQPGDETTLKDLVGTAMLKRSLDQVADMGAAIGRTEQAAHYRQQAEQAARAFQAAFVKPDGTIGNGSQASYIMAIRIGLLTPEQTIAAGKHLVADIRRRGTLLSTGFLGTPLSLDAIADIGDVGLVYDLLLRTEFPSWGYMVKKGATTIWERWNGDTGDVAMNSYNHYALGAVIGFLYRRIAGIEEMEPGFAKVRIAPLIDPRVPSAGADYDSVRGRISVHWVRQPDGATTYDIVVPANMRAEIHLPAPSDGQVKSGGVAIGADPAVDVIRNDRQSVIVAAGSGTYRFTSKGAMAG